MNELKQKGFSHQDIKPDNILISYKDYLKFTDLAVPGSSGVIITVAFFSGIILTTIGITGLYIARIYEQTQGRPRYIIKNIIEAKNK